MPVYCHNCGAQIPDGSKFCNNCGANVSIFNQNSVETVSTSLPPKQKKKRGWLKALLYIALIFVLIGGCYIFFNPETRDIYIFTKITVNSEYDKDELLESAEEIFADTYLLKNSDGYLVANLETGLGFSESDVKEAALETTTIEFSSFGNYALIEITDNTTGESARVSYTKVKLGQRLYFLSKYYYW